MRDPVVSGPITSEETARVLMGSGGCVVLAEIAKENGMLYERERCARIAEGFAHVIHTSDDGTSYSVGEEIAARIRAGD